MARPTCRFHNLPGGCRQGANCKFSHTNRSTDRNETQASPCSSSSSPLTPRSPPTERQSSPSSSIPLPRGVCRFYWETGNCRREFDCRFEHTQKMQPTGNRFAGIAVASQAAQELIAPFLTEKGLAKLSGSGTDGFFAQDNLTSLSPTEAHSKLKRFLQDNFRFNTTLQIYAFLIPLISANTTNKLWVCFILTWVDIRSTIFDLRHKKKDRFVITLALEYCFILYGD